MNNQWQCVILKKMIMANNSNENNNDNEKQ